MTGSLSGENREDDPERGWYRVDREALARHLESAKNQGTFDFVKLFLRQSDQARTPEEFQSFAREETDEVSGGRWTRTRLSSPLTVVAHLRSPREDLKDSEG